MIIGACKSGTSGLYRDLAAHPNAFLPSKKEPDILHRARSEGDARRRYGRHFVGAPEDKVVGEASTYYTMVPEFDSPARFAARLLPEDTRLIYIMRDPIARIESQLAFGYAIGRLRHTDFDRAVREDPAYVSWSDYPRQLRPWLDHFDRSCFLFLKFEDYVAERAETVRQAAAFLGLDPEAVAPEAKIFNARGSHLRARSPLIKRVIFSDYLMRRIAPKTPRLIKTLAKSALTEKMPDVQPTLSAETVDFVQERLGDIGKRLEAIGVPGFDWERRPGLDHSRRDGSA